MMREEEKIIWFIFLVKSLISCCWIEMTRSRVGTRGLCVWNMWKDRRSFFETLFFLLLLAMSCELYGRLFFTRIHCCRFTAHVEPSFCLRLEVKETRDIWDFRSFQLLKCNEPIIHFPTRERPKKVSLCILPLHPCQLLLLFVLFALRRRRAFASIFHFCCL